VPLRAETAPAAPSGSPPSAAASPNLGQAFQPAHIGSTVPLPSDLQAWLDQQERDILIRALREAGFNRTATAARLGISLRQIRYRIARLNITAPNDLEPHDDIG
jgi:two-component system response regulator PilR (NtrC family)